MLLSILLSVIFGFLTGLGIGGGSLLVLWLTAVEGMEAATARGVNLLFFLPGAAISLIFRRRQGNLPLKKILPAILFGCITALLGSWASQAMDSQVLKKLFGALLLFAGVREILYNPK